MASKGRPKGSGSLYTEALAQAICERLAQGESLSSICRDEGMPPASTVRQWERDREDFATVSQRARELGCHALADECLEIADDSRNDFMDARAEEGDEQAGKFNGEHVQRSRLRIDTRMRLLGKWLPKVYGERTELAGTITVKKQAADLTDDELALIAAKKSPGST